jgi:hypothetical protein
VWDSIFDSALASAFGSPPISVPMRRARVEAPQLHFLPPQERKLTPEVQRALAELPATFD